MTESLRKTDNCFVCGAMNAEGLRASFEVDLEKRSILGRFTPRPVHEGWEGVVHGGVLTALMDEAMVKLAAHLGMPVVSAEMTVKFKAPARPGEELMIRGTVASSRHRIVFAEAEVTRGAMVIAEAKGKLLRI
jgi:uncharacterized protein (TIGR00369 family)